MLKGCRFPFELENWIPNSQTFLFPKGSRGALFRWLPYVCTSCSYNRLVGNLQLQRQWRSIVSLSTHKPKSNQKRRNNLRWCHNCSERLTFWAKSSDVSNWKAAVLLYMLVQCLWGNTNIQFCHLEMAQWYEKACCANLLSSGTAQNLIRVCQVLLPVDVKKNILRYIRDDAWTLC